ncbi:MAG: dimethylhistidine N-methyltransferase [Nitrosomonas sp.]|jgi:L-histidine Nalpha-methyltransferase|nr:MAG: dimethylhistidine N-methyltransferase [Nitrosomonas sp.]
MKIATDKVITDITDLNFLTDVYQGLKSIPKTLPCKYLYDDYGSLLFEQITQLKEYYLTRAELEILDNHIEDIALQLGSDAIIIEPGCGAGHKVQKLLEAVDQPNTFIPFEISREMLKYSVNRLNTVFPQLKIKPLLGDFTHQKFVQQITNQTELSKSSNVVFFPGSTIGNFSKTEAIKILENFKRLSGINGKVLLGIDLIKDRNMLLSAYDDAKGITAQFNKNILTRINTELNADFDVQEGFKHFVKFNENLSRIEMHLMSCRTQVVQIAEERFHFNQMETIHTENSHKYSIASFSDLTFQAGLSIEKYWCDNENRFAVCLLAA